MISVLHIFATFYILFTLLADYVKSHPLILAGSLNFGETKEDSMAVSDEEAQDIAGPTADRITEGLTNLQSSLEALQTSAAQMVEDEQKALKRPRLDDGSGDSHPKPSDSHGAHAGFG